MLENIHSFIVCLRRSVAILTLLCPPDLCRCSRSRRPPALPELSPQSCCLAQRTTQTPPSAGPAASLLLLAPWECLFTQEKTKKLFSPKPLLLSFCSQAFLFLPSSCCSSCSSFSSLASSTAGVAEVSSSSSSSAQRTNTSSIEEWMRKPHLSISAFLTWFLLSVCHHFSGCLGLFGVGNHFLWEKVHLGHFGHAKPHSSTSRYTHSMEKISKHTHASFLQQKKKKEEERRRIQI